MRFLPVYPPCSSIDPLRALTNLPSEPHFTFPQTKPNQKKEREKKNPSEYICTHMERFIQGEEEVRVRMQLNAILANFLMCIYLKLPLEVWTLTPFLLCVCFCVDFNVVTMISLLTRIDELASLNYTW